jgi:uncharacterized phiE125 gp8 family phage protein
MGFIGGSSWAAYRPGPHVALSVVPPAADAAPILEPLSMDDAKLSAKLELTAEDDLIPRWITAARQKVEHDTGYALVPQAWDLGLDTFPRGRALTVPRPPLRAVTWIKAYDSAGMLQTVSSALYVVDTTSTPGRILLADTGVWPTDLRRAQPITVRFDAGWLTDTAVPEGLLVAMRLVVGWLAQNREPSTFERQAYDEWIAPYVIPVVG